ncbi:MAG: glycosyl hydrolase [Bacteroidetes bacterium HGW-Bacteroidetes-1]|jgi:predicted dehydrogenase|nr:MAG: glycosyl hydrolase [Bacteroidetes bacterium HGW-Bacteroidetes-1]
MNRQNFLKMTALAGTAFTILPSKVVFGSPNSKLRLGFIGVGLRGQELLRLSLQRSDVIIPAICDVQPVMIADALKQFENSTHPIPQVYTDSDFSYRDLLVREDIDAVIIATPWEWHYSMALETMEAGKHVGCEVIMGTTVNEHWDIVRKSESTGKQYMMLENVCYRRDVMAILQIIRQGVFGELIHLQGGYQHDLREVKFNDGNQPYGGGVEFGEKGFSEARWRTQHSVNRNGDLYPTHGIGPLSKMLDIHSGNRFTSLVSMASKARGLHEYIVKKGGINHPNAKVNFKLGDMVTTMISTENGETILLQHDTSLPRPYSLGFRVQGTKGLWMDINKSIHIEDVTNAHRWEEAKEWISQFDHPLWKKYSSAAEGAGHGGMDFFVVNAFIEAIKRNEPTPISVYDSAAWSVITPLSEASVANGFTNVPFPDFTDGKWKTGKQYFALDDQY